jgi:hypothetical protein
VQSNYEVVATFCESQPEFSFAVLRDVTKKQRLVKTGDSIDGMKVVSIDKEGVLVLQGGVRVLLKTVEASTGVPVAPAPAVSSAGLRPTFVGGRPSRPGLPAPWDQLGVSQGPTGVQPPAAGPATAPGASPVPGVAAAQEEDPFALTREELQKYVNDLPTLLSQVEFSPHVDAKQKPDGLQVVSLLPQSVAAQRGLRQGDVVKMICDVPITDLGQIPPLARKILADDPAFIEMVIEREGKEESLIYEVR